MKCINEYSNYQINHNGDVIRFGKKLKVRPSKNGYARVLLCKDGKAKDFYIHRLVAETFIPNPNNKPTVNHKDGNKLNNTLSNLEWNTHSENALHSYEKLNRISLGGAPLGNINWKNTNRNKLGQYEKN